MQKHGLEEFEYERGGVHIRLKKASRTSGAPAAAAAPRLSRRSARPSANPRVLPSASAPIRVSRPALRRTCIVIKSPIVGTFYASPSPEAEPFVTVGRRVEPGQVLCIIEAMKLMNEIESDVAGEVVADFGRERAAGGIWRAALWHSPAGQEIARLDLARSTRGAPSCFPHLTHVQENSDRQSR